jgi:hypothetical protein
MKKDKTTKWYPPEVKPVRTGLYECADAKYPNLVWLDWWDGAYWCYEHTRKPFSPAEQSRFVWRGLAKKAA